ncbi:MAG TPA: DUF1592 domain-containing protein [Polyangiaceae bacterium]|nr:DUF1592 domain-containing protein [Polyangiaceae bacterium]
MRTLRHPLVLLAFAGCVGTIGDPPDGFFDGTDPGDPRLEARVWRLSPSQYNTEVQRMFPGAPSVNLPEASSEYGLTNIAATARIDIGNASQFNDAARTLGSWVTTQGAAAARCNAFGTAECVDTFLGWFPEAAFRRRPSPEEIAELRSVYDDVVPTYGPEWAFTALVRTVLLSPQFLYRTEIGPDGTGVVGINDYEIASLMAFSLTDIGPDAELLADAAAGRLRDPAAREAHARRLMALSAPVWQRFFWEWMKLSTLESQGNETELDPALVQELEAEYREFVTHIVVEDRGGLKELLTTSHTWATPAVAAYYGAMHPGTGVEQIELDPAQRGGLLTLGAWLVSHGKKGRDNVVRRGMAVYRDAMCNDIAPLNIDLEAATKELVGADATIKEIAEARSSDPTCGACHSTSDPVGLAFESFAGNGTWQTTYPDGKPVEAAVTWNGVAYDNAPQVAAALADDEEFQRCLVQRFGHFVMGADFGDPVRVRAPREAYQVFKDSGGSFEELLVAIVRDRSFIERRK